MLLGQYTPQFSGPQTYVAEIVFIVELFVAVRTLEYRMLVSGVVDQVVVRVAIRFAIIADVMQ